MTLKSNVRHLVDEARKSDWMIEPTQLGRMLITARSALPDTNGEVGILVANLGDSTTVIRAGDDVGEAVRAVFDDVQNDDQSTIVAETVVVVDSTSKLSDDLETAKLSDVFRRVLTRLQDQQSNLLFLGRESLTPVDLQLAAGSTIDRSSSMMNDETSAAGYVCRLQEKLLTAFDQARKNSAKASDNRQQKYNKNVKAVQFAKDERVAVKIARLNPGEYSKWKRKFDTCYQVLKQTGPVNYMIKNLQTGKKSVVHVGRLKKLKTSTHVKQ